MPEPRLLRPRRGLQSARQNSVLLRDSKQSLTPSSSGCGTMFHGERRSWRCRRSSSAPPISTPSAGQSKKSKRRAAFLDGPPGFLSSETHAWLSEVDAVAVELATLAKRSRYEILNRGHERPNEYRAWLVGKQIPALFEKVYGKTLRITPEASTARGKRGVNFVHLALEELDERDPIAGPISGQTIKSLIHNAKKYG